MTTTTREMPVPTRQRDDGADLRLFVAIPLPEPVEQALGGAVNPAAASVVGRGWRGGLHDSGGVPALAEAARIPEDDGQMALELGLEQPCDSGVCFT